MKIQDARPIPGVNVIAWRGQRTNGGTWKWRRVLARPVRVRDHYIARAALAQAKEEK